MSTAFTVRPSIGTITHGSIPDSDSWLKHVEIMGHSINGDRHEMRYFELFLYVGFDIPGGFKAELIRAPFEDYFSRSQMTVEIELTLPPYYQGDRELYLWWGLEEGMWLGVRQLQKRLGTVDFSEVERRLSVAAQALGMQRFPVSPGGDVVFPDQESWAAVGYPDTKARNGWLYRPAWLVWQLEQPEPLYPQVSLGGKWRRVRDAVIAAAETADSAVVKEAFAGALLKEYCDDWVVRPRGLTAAQVGEVVAALGRIELPTNAEGSVVEGLAMLRDFYESVAELGWCVGQGVYGGPDAVATAGPGIVDTISTEVQPREVSGLVPSKRWVAARSDHEGFLSLGASSLEGLGLCWAFAEYSGDEALDLQGLMRGVHWVFTGSASFVPESLVSAAFFGFDGELSCGGGPIRLSAEQVAQVFAAVGAMSFDEVRERFVPSEMVAAGVEPAVWEQDDVWGAELEGLVTEFVSFFGVAAEMGEGVVLGVLEPPTEFVGWGDNNPFS